MDASSGNTLSRDANKPATVCRKDRPGYTLRWMMAKATVGVQAIAIWTSTTRKFGPPIEMRRPTRANPTINNPKVSNKNKVSGFM